MSYAEDMAALLARTRGHAEYPLNPVLEFVSSQSENIESKEGTFPVSSGRLACIMGGAGEGKSTLAAALAERKWFDAIHFCKKADVRRQDKALVIRSLSYQLASRHAAFAQSILALTPAEVVWTADYTVRCSRRVSRGWQGSEPSVAAHDGYRQDMRRKEINNRKRNQLRGHHSIG